MTRPEIIEQSQFIEWCHLHKNTFKGLDLIFAIPNGAHLAGNKLNRIKQVASLKAQGMKSGVPDLFLPVAQGDYHGLFIEMKSSKGIGKTKILKSHMPSEKQEWWLDKLGKQGYKTVVCYGFDMAVKAIERYYGKFLIE